MSRKPWAPAPPGSLTTTMGWDSSPCFCATPWISRAIWSAPPPVPAGTMKVMLRLGFQSSALAAVGARASTQAAAAMAVNRLSVDSALVIASSHFTRC